MNEHLNLILQKIHDFSNFLPMTIYISIYIYENRKPVQNIFFKCFSLFLRLSWEVYFLEKNHQKKTQNQNNPVIVCDIRQRPIRIWTGDSKDTDSVYNYCAVLFTRLTRML